MTTIAIKLRDALTAAIANSQTLSSIDLDKVLDSEELHSPEVNRFFWRLLSARRQVAITWDIADVKSIRPDLNDDQAWEVLRQAERHYDCEWGFTWTHVETVADYMFPALDEGEGQ